MKLKDFLISDLFHTVRGKSLYTRDFAKKNAGPYPVYSAGRGAPLANIGTYDHDGEFLSWTTNGYAGYVQILTGRFSINSDRGLLSPINPKNLDLNFCRLVLQPKLRNQAIGRIIDGKKNEYTKLSPTAVSETTITLPVDDSGLPDRLLQAELARKYLKIEAFQKSFDEIHDQLLHQSIQLPSLKSFKTVSISDENLFKLQIGNRILKKDIQKSGFPIYSANVSEPFGFISRRSSVLDFSLPSLLWGIDGIFDWNLIAANEPFVPTDHCGVLHVKSQELDAEYVYFALKSTKDQYGFDRTFRASLENMKEVVTLMIPINAAGEFDITIQKEIATRHKKLQELKNALVNQLDSLLYSPITFE